MTSSIQRGMTHEPERTCIGCRERATKSELLRVTRGSDLDGRTIVAPDLGGTAPGRGAYLHPTVACLALAERRRAFGRALRHTEGSLSLSELRTYLESKQVETQQRSVTSETEK
ncbi:MAG: YlxR family protein [Marmoricola sp.]